MVRKIANHQVTAHAETTLEKIRLVRAGKQLSGEHKVFGAAYRLLDPEKPSPTVTRSGFRDFIHPSEDRLCTVRELARLQTFPDSYVLKGRRCDTYATSRYKQQTQHEQLGNAVPLDLPTPSRNQSSDSFSPTRIKMSPSSRFAQRSFTSLTARTQRRISATRSTLLMSSSTSFSRGEPRRLNTGAHTRLSAGRIGAGTVYSKPT